MDKLVIGILIAIIFGVAVSCCLDSVYGNNKIETKQDSMFKYYDESVQRANDMNMGGN